ncbi:hypothetical protein TNCV_2439941 [Trichonephila clavipes]|nr:hypothetical protein TNCV_2439941 [Trichonephila clavipes]
MTTTSYRSRSAVGVRHLFPSRHYSAVRSVVTRNVLVHAERGTMTTTSYRSRSAVGVRHLFSVEALLCCPVASWCTRNDDNDIYRNRAAVGVRHLFPSRHYSAVRSRLGARGTMTTTSYRSRNQSAVGVRHFFPSRHSAVRSRLGARGTMTTTSYRSRSAVGVRHFVTTFFVVFSVEALLCCPVASWCTRNDDNDILPQSATRRWVFVTFFRRGTTLLSGRVLVHAER